MGRGRKPTRGGRRQFTDVETLKQQSRELNKRRQEEDLSEDEDNDDDEAGSSNQVINRQGAVGELPPSDSESESDEEKATGDSGSKNAPGAAQGNQIQQRNKKLNDLTLENLDINDEKRGLNRKEREELAKQEAKKRYQALTAAGKTDEAKADLARLAIIRQQREEAAKKREAEQKAKEEAAKAKLDARAKAQRNKI